MRYARPISLAVLVMAAALAAGCESPPPAREPIVLRPMPAGNEPGEVRAFQVRFVFLQHRVRPDAPVEDMWRLLSTTSIPYEKQALWEKNDLRMGEGARLAAERMNELATETPDRTAQVSILTVREDQDFLISVGGERETLDILWTDAAGRLMGRRFERAVTQFRCVCRRDTEAGGVRIALVPEVTYGEERMRWVRGESTMVPRTARASFDVMDLAAEVHLEPGRLLVLGGRRSSDVSLGGAMFHEKRGPDVWVQTVIVTAEPLRPGQIPEGGTVPFLTPAGLTPKMPAKLAK
jgi:hypothetical protein